jgi:hypothetical protein
MEQFQRVGCFAGSGGRETLMFFFSARKAQDVCMEVEGTPHPSEHLGLFGRKKNPNLPLPKRKSQRVKKVL